jgi:hypothetical protein
MVNAMVKVKVIVKEVKEVILVVVMAMMVW